MLRALVTISLPFAAALAAAAPPPKPLPPAVACPYSPGTLAVTLGMSFKEGVAREAAVPGGKQTTCSYEHTAGSMVFSVKQTVKPAAEHARERAEFERNLGPLTPIPNDPDGATWQFDRGSSSGVALHYLRGTHRVELRIHGGAKPASTMQGKLLRLKRLP